MTNTRERLLQELEDCRWFALHQLADEAEESGDHILARGWRWLAVNKKWPYTIGRDIYYTWDWDDDDCEEDENCLPNEILTTGINNYRTSNITEFLTHTAKEIGQFIHDTGRYPE